jgi:hypothetical protein
VLIRKVILGFSFLLIYCQCSKKINEIPQEIESEKTISDEYKEKLFSQHKRLMFECFKNYMEYSTFRDSTGNVSTEAVVLFKELFIDNAKVWNDVVLEPSMIEVNAYADEIWLYFNDTGVNVEYNKNIINEFFTPYSEQFEPVIDKSDPELKTMKYRFKTKKRVYSILNSENEIVTHEKPIEYDLIFIFHVSTSSSKWAKIIDIIPEKN